jgi:hypothetical protein
MLLSENLTKPAGNTSLRRRIILYTFNGLALISFCGSVFVDYYFSQHSPREPEPEVGRTYRVVSNKVDVYLTKRELIALRVPGYSFFLWFAAILYFGVRWKFMQVAVKEPEYIARAQVTKKKKKKKGDSG